jgi:hypothetical protein
MDIEQVFISHGRWDDSGGMKACLFIHSLCPGGDKEWKSNQLSGVSARKACTPGMIFIYRELKRCYHFASIFYPVMLDIKVSSCDDFKMVRHSSVSYAPTIRIMTTAECIVTSVRQGGRDAGLL